MTKNETIMPELKKKIANYKKKNILVYDKNISKFSNNYQNKARHNLLIARALEKFNKSEKILDLFNLPDDFETYDWVIICSYYSMYMSALSSLAKISVKCENHTAVPLALAYYFVLNQELEKEYVHKLEKAQIAQEISKLEKAKKDRIAAQYDVTAKIKEEMTKDIVADAEQFVNRIEILLSSIAKTNKSIAKTNNKK